MSAPPAVPVHEPPSFEAELLRRARTGEEAAFTALVDRWHPRIVRWARGILDDGDDADDVAQQVLVRLYVHLPRLRGSAGFPTWLYQVTRNAARDALRRRARRIRVVERMRRQSDEPADRALGPEPMPEDDVVTRARTALARLPERQRELFDLVDLQGYAPQEAAALVGIAPATARVHLLRARRTLRALLLGRREEDR